MFYIRLRIDFVDEYNWSSAFRNLLEAIIDYDIWQSFRSGSKMSKFYFNTFHISSKTLSSRIRDYQKFNGTYIKQCVHLGKRNQIYVLRKNK